MKKSVLIIVVFCILLSSSINAENVNTLVHVYPDGTAKITQNLVVDSLNLNKGFVFPAMQPEMAEVFEDNKPIKFAVLNDTFLIRPIKRSARNQLKINYLTNSLTKKNKNTWELNFYAPYATPIIFSFSESTKIINFSEKAVIFSEDGQIKLGWKLPANSSIKIVYESEIQVPRENYYKWSLYAIVSVLSGFIVVVCLKRGYCKITKKLSKGKKDIIKTLDKKESEVVYFLINNQNKSYQSMIQKETGINKSTLSRTIKRLENKNIIEVRETGNTNLILLTEWFIKK